MWPSWCTWVSRYCKQSETSGRAKSSDEHPLDEADGKRQDPFPNDPLQLHFPLLSDASRHLALPAKELHHAEDVQRWTGTSCQLEVQYAKPTEFTFGDSLHPRVDSFQIGFLHALNKLGHVTGYRRHDEYDRQPNERAVKVREISNTFEQELKPYLHPKTAYRNTIQRMIFRGV